MTETSKEIKKPGSAELLQKSAELKERSAKLKQEMDITLKACDELLHPEKANSSEDSAI